MQLTQEIVRELLDYNPDTGVLTWKYRDVKWFASTGSYKSWNTKYANKNAGTVTVGFGGKRYLKLYILSKMNWGHRVIWLHTNGRWPEQVDHINGDGADNRLINIREVSRSENMKNMRKTSANSSGVTGVYWNKATSSWRAIIVVRGKPVQIGMFGNLPDAAKARKKAEIKYGFHENHGSDRPL